MVEKVNDHNIITLPERVTRSRYLNPFNIFLMNQKCEFSRMIPLDKAELRSNKSPRSLPNEHRENHSGSLLLQRCASRTI